MFPLRDFLQRHGRPAKIEDIPDKLRDLFPNAAACTATMECFQADQDGLVGGIFEIEQTGYEQPRRWLAEVVVLRDFFTAILLRIT